MTSEYGFINKRYLPFVLSKYDVPNGDEGTSQFEKQQIVIVDVKNSKMYSKEIDKSTVEDCAYTFFYDYNLDSLMVITNGGELKKVNLSNDSMEFEKYKTINLENYKMANINAWFPNEKALSGNIVFSMRNKNDNSYAFGTYNIDTGNFKIIDNTITNITTLGKNNLFITRDGESFYLSEIDELCELKHLYKFESESKSLSVFGAVNEEGNSIFISKFIFGDKSYREEHSFLELSN